MANSQKGNLVDLVDEIAKKLMANEKINTNEIDYIEPLNQKKEEYKSGIMEKINAVYNAIEQEFPGIILPDGILMAIAENISKQIELNGIKIPDQINVDQTIVEDVVQTVCEKTGTTVETLKQQVVNREVGQVPVTNVDTVAGMNTSHIIYGRDGAKIFFEEPEDPRYAFKDEEDKMEEEVIENKRAELLHLIDNIDEHPENLAQVLQIIRETPNGLGIDAGLRYFAEELNSISHVEGNDVKLGVSQLISSEPKMEAFKALVEEIKLNKNFRDDKFTTANKLNIITSILAHDRTSPVPTELKIMLQDMDPKCYKMVKNNLDSFIRLQEENAFEEEVFANESYNRESFLKGMDERVKVISAENKIPIMQRVSMGIKEFAAKSRQLIQVARTTLGLGPKTLPEADVISPKGPKNEIATPPKQIKSADKYANLKLVLQQKMKATGTKKCVDYVMSCFDQEQDEDVKKFFAYAILDTLKDQEQIAVDNESKTARRNLFMYIIDNHIYNEDILKRMGRLDEGLSKELIEYYGNSLEKGGLGIALTLGEGISEIKQPQNTLGKIGMGKVANNLDNGER